MWIAAGIGFTGWLSLDFRPTGVPGAILESDAAIASPGVTTHCLNPKRAGLIFFPLGMVDPVAYAPLLRRATGAGYSARLLFLPVPCGCTASQTEGLFGEIESILTTEQDTAWILAGHSRGGMLATRSPRKDKGAARARPKRHYTSTRLQLG